MAGRRDLGAVIAATTTDYREADGGDDTVDPSGGHFFGCEHAMEHYETAFYRPMLCGWTIYENW